ncbi:DUF397 domain-containing protein [Saccharopolyspora pogona]|uniref:DUF397 domain-containing protein n=1 Tax=Saccharopolyspora pogona TaxID=333966 RepID=UPI001CC246B7|nr:DUF397 domain-containing protein [Saccharopolyspora pogona]
MSPTPLWRKSSRSAQAGNCVEVATNMMDTALVRDSKLGDSSPTMVLSRKVFAGFIGSIRSGRFDG